MGKKFSELRARMTPPAREAAAARTRELIAEMTLSEIRKAVGLTQTELADMLGIKQGSLSQMEGQSDIQLSTLRRLVEALGGQLEIVARFPSGSIKVSQFEETVSTTGAD